MKQLLCLLDLFQSRCIIVAHHWDAFEAELCLAVVLVEEALFLHKEFQLLHVSRVLKAFVNHVNFRFNLKLLRLQRK